LRQIAIRQKRYGLILKSMSKKPYSFEKTDVRWQKIKNITANGTQLKNRVGNYPQNFIK